MKRTDNFEIIYKILHTLENAMDLYEADCELLSAQALGISETRWKRLMFMISQEKYVSGIEYYYTPGNSLPNIYFTNPEITLKGMEYLAQNPLMVEFARENCKE